MSRDAVREKLPKGLKLESSSAAKEPMGGNTSMCKCCPHGEGIRPTREDARSAIPDTGEIQQGHRDGKGLLIVSRLADQACPLVDPGPFPHR